jgi:secernin
VCDTVVVVRPGAVLFAKNSDRDPNEAQLLEWQPARDHAPGTALACTWIDIPEVEHTHAIVISRPYWMWGAEMGANEHGVVVGNEAVFTRAGSSDEGLLGMDLVRLALERAASAEEAAAIITSLVERHGQGGRCGYDDAGFRYDNSFLVADGRMAFVVETAGREHAIERVAPPVRAISNGLTIPAFAARHADRVRGTVARCQLRRARAESLARHAHRAAEMAVVLRDHGPGRDMPRYHPINGAMDAPCMHAGGLVASSQTVASLIAHLTPEGVRLFATGTAAPCLSAFKPIDVATPIDVGGPTGLEDATSPWWRFERLHRAVVGDRERTLSLRHARDEWERDRWETRASEEAFAEWDRFVARQTELAAEAKDERPWYVRRYWRARQSDARSSGARLPSFSPRG